MVIQGEGAHALPTPLVSVIVPTYKRPDLVRKAIRSLLQQDLGMERYEIIVADSSPDDQVVAVLSELQASSACVLRCAHQTERQDAGPSRNRGARLARGAFFAFIDSDCEAAPGWLREGLAAFEDDVGLVQGRTLADPAARKDDGFTWYVVVEKEGGFYETCNMFYRRAVFEEAGGFISYGFDPGSTTTLGGEDVDLAWRVKRKGWKSRFAPEALVYHAVVPLPPLRWLLNKRLFILPSLVKNFPELRPRFFARYFYDRSQAAFVAALLGFFLGPFVPAGFVLCVPYGVLRASEPTRTLRGVLRPLRALVYLPRDAISFLLLLGGSLRYRSLLL